MAFFCLSWNGGWTVIVLFDRGTFCIGKAVTNEKGQFQLDNIKALGIEEYFDPILVSEWGGIKKPQSQIFGRALKQLGILPEEALFIGDHPINDVQGARDVGMISVWKKDGQWTKVAADYIIEDLSELPNLIQVINR